MRTNYILGQGLRKTKWRWSIWLLTFYVPIVNFYLLNKPSLEMCGLKPKSHYTCQEEVFTAWMDSDMHLPTRCQIKRKDCMKLIAETPVNLHLPSVPCLQCTECQLHQIVNKLQHEQMENSLHFSVHIFLLYHTCSELMIMQNVGIYN